MDVSEKIESGAYTNKLIRRHDVRAYARETAELMSQFQRDLEVEFSLVGNPKAGLLFDKAWELSHSYGLREVHDTYGDLAELVK